jgi:hypothetical protein
MEKEGMSMKPVQVAVSEALKSLKGLDAKA